MVKIAFRGKKSYGRSRMDNCPFCGKGAFTKNEQGVPTCTDHKKTLVEDIKCVCSGWLDIREGKWGPYLLCGNCGPMNWKKGMGMNDNQLKILELGQKIKSESTKEKPKPVQEVKSAYPEPKPKPSNSRFHRAPREEAKERVVRSDELDFL